MHPHTMPRFRQPEVMLVGAGAGADVVGGIDAPAPAHVNAVLNAFPRLQFKKLFVQACGEVANKYPGAAKRTFMREIAGSTKPAYKASNICDAIAAAPYSE